MHPDSRNVDQEKDKAREPKAATGNVDAIICFLLVSFFFLFPKAPF
jgi:hypothetical protein